MALTTIINMSISAGFLILIIVLVRQITFHKIPKNTFLVLWGVVLVRLLVPFSISSPLSIFNLLSIQLSGGNNILVTSNHQPGNLPTGITITANELIKDDMGLFAKENIILIVWIAGALLAVLFFVLEYRKSRIIVSSALPIEKIQAVDEWKNRQNMKRPLRILYSDKLNTPISWGIANPKIVLPKSIDFNDQTFLNNILNHEYSHLCRFDMLWKILMCLAICIHWFNPLVWIMFVLANRDLELTCDEKVIKKLSKEGREGYAKTLIFVAELKQKNRVLASAFAKNAAEERIVSIMRYKKATVWAVVISIMLVFTIPTIFASAPMRKTVEKPPLYDKNENIESLPSIVNFEDTDKANKDNRGESGGEQIIIENLDDNSEKNETEYDVFAGDEWWDYQEYLEWIEQEKIKLEQLISDGIPDYYDINGEPRDYTQQDIDGLVEWHILIAESIKNGQKVPKDIDGDEFMPFDNRKIWR